VVALLTVLPQGAQAATIVVDGTTCSLIDAILAANTDSATGGCPAGNGADTIELTIDVLLTATYSFDAGLPALEGEVVLLGNGHVIARDHSAPGFRIALTGQGSQVTLEDVTLDNGDVRGATFPNGGALFVFGNTTLRRVTVSNSQATAGGGIFIADILTLEDSTVSGNAADAAGGGIHNSGMLFVRQSTVSGNVAVGDGGGVYTAGESVTELTNSTLSGNSAGGEGGGVFVGTLENSIVANSGSAGNCRLVTDLGNNFSDDGTCLSGFGLLTGLDPTLADNGGPTLTHALLADSSAIDAAGACGFDTDQRGAPRDDSCDSGAYEFQFESQCSIELDLDQDETWITFTPESAAFDVVTGPLRGLLAGGDFDDAVCMGSYPSSPAIDLLADPDPGQARYFLARGLTSCVGAGYGQSSLSPDPRDALNAGPCP
jgi:hypothetical protein